MREDQVDAGRKGAPSQTKAIKGVPLPVNEYRGDWLGAYGGGLGTASQSVPDSDGDTDAD